MKYRKKMSKKQSRKAFTHGAMHVQGKNVQNMPMRGGIRL